MWKGLQERMDQKLKPHELWAFLKKTENINVYIAFQFLKKCHFVLDTLLCCVEKRHEKPFFNMLQKRLEDKSFFFASWDIQDPCDIVAMVKYFYGQCFFPKTWEDVMALSSIQCRDYFLGLSWWYDKDDHKMNDKYKRHVRTDEEAFCSFCHDGHLECVQLFSSSGIRLPKFALAEAAQAGHFDVVSWLVETFYPLNAPLSAKKMEKPSLLSRLK